MPTWTLGASSWRRISYVEIAGHGSFCAASAGLLRGYQKSPVWVVSRLARPSVVVRIHVCPRIYASMMEGGCAVCTWHS
jgi:hypothetical protein